MTDYKMEPMNGLELLEQVRAAYPELPVIFFTGRGGEDIASEAIHAGVSDYLRKGSSDQFTVLGNRIETIVGRYRAEQRAAAADRKIREVYERIPIAFFALDADLRFTYCNEQANDYFREPEAVLEGETVWSVIAKDEPFEGTLRKAMDTQEPTHCSGEIRDSGDSPTPKCTCIPPMTA